MATHIDVLCGNYQDVVAGNDRGINADLLYWQNNGAMNFYSMYRTHNYHFKLYGAMFLGQFGALRPIPQLPRELYVASHSRARAVWTVASTRR